MLKINAFCTISALYAFDWSRVREGLKEKLKNDERIMEKYDQRLWAFDMDLFDALMEFEEREVSDEEIKQYI